MQWYSDTLTLVEWFFKLQKCVWMWLVQTRNVLKHNKHCNVFETWKPSAVAFCRCTWVRGMTNVFLYCIQYLFQLQPHPSSLSAGSEDSQGGRAAHTAAVLPATPGRKTGSSTWIPAVKTSTNELHQSFRHGTVYDIYHIIQKSYTKLVLHWISQCTSYSH